MDMTSYSRTIIPATAGRKKMSDHVSLNTAKKRVIESPFFHAKSVLHKISKVLHKTPVFVLVTGTFLCDLRVSDRFSEYKENPENTGFSGFVALFRYSVELSLAELRSATSCFETVLNISMVRFSLILRAFSHFLLSVVLFLNHGNQ